ncbi:MAG: hypothetical protein ABR956_06920 [Terracidiphilus sp.]|jgi:tetraacyldisaccharide-1-P 4'-kinase
MSTIMAQRTDELEYLVLQAVANDFEEFGMIVSDIAKWTSGNQSTPDHRHIEQALMAAIAREEITAYECSETTNQLITTQADTQKLRELWFYITEQGKTRMQRLEAMEEEG